jgi:hypothetical protein
MIHLAIDEEQRAESREQRMAAAIDASWFQPFSALCSHLSALPQSHVACDEEVARLLHVHRQSQGVDE